MKRSVDLASSFVNKEVLHVEILYNCVAMIFIPNNYFPVSSNFDPKAYNYKIISKIYLQMQQTWGNNFSQSELNTDEIKLLQILLLSSNIMFAVCFV